MELILQLDKSEIPNSIVINKHVYEAFKKNNNDNNRSYCIINSNNTITINNSFLEDSKVNDCIRIINDTFQKMKIKDGWNDSSKQISHENIDHENNIVLILESPHADEYTDDFIPLCPANGQTGKNINTYLIKILSQVCKKDIKSLDQIILCNPIQWQTSLHELHKQPLTRDFKKLRDDVWNKLWVEEYKSFGKRLDQYKPNIIINACTKKLKPVVKEFLINKYRAYDKPDIYVTNHPSSWWSPRNQSIQKIE